MWRFAVILEAGCLGRWWNHFSDELRERNFAKVGNSKEGEQEQEDCRGISIR
jgi:hypothetical protein